MMMMMIYYSIWNILIGQCYITYILDLKHIQNAPTYSATDICGPRSPFPAKVRIDINLEVVKAVKGCPYIYVQWVGKFREAVRHSYALRTNDETQRLSSQQARSCQMSNLVSFSPFTLE